MVLTILPSLPVPNPSISYWHTTHPNKLVHHRTTARLPERASVVIIGSGITGAFAAKQLVEDGVDDVLVLEAREICSGATGRNGGHCSPQLYGNQTESADFEVQNLDAISKLVAESQIPCEFFRFVHGACHACYTQESFDEARKAVAQTTEESPRLGSLLEVIDDKPTLSTLKITNSMGAVMSTEAAALHPYKLVTWVWDDLLRTTKLNLQTGTPVKAVTQDNGSVWKVETPRGIVSASHVLLATNAYTARLLPEFSSMIVPVQGEMAALRSPAAIHASPLTHAYVFLGLNPHEDYLVQRPVDSGGHLMFGGGRHVARHEGVGVSDDSYVDSAVARYLETTLPRLMNLQPSNSEGIRVISSGKDVIDEIIGKDMNVEAVWTGIMGFSRDRKPWVGGVPGKMGLWLCAGYTGHGMPNTSLSAKHIAQLISSSLRGEDWQKVEREAVRARLIPASYTISKARMLQAAKLPKIRPQSQEQP